MKIEEVVSYEVLEKREIKELRSTAYLCRHKKTDAKVVLMENDDENKVFYIGFRTTPRESTGVSHILEHSVLCGSKNFPLKDPFVELVKGSLNTFLNAMTYPDKTVYPIASCNEKDFQNLMHVYMVMYIGNVHLLTHLQQWGEKRIHLPCAEKQRSYEQEKEEVYDEGGMEEGLTLEVETSVCIWRSDNSYHMSLVIEYGSIHHPVSVVSDLLSVDEVSLAEVADVVICLFIQPASHDHSLEYLRRR